LRDTNEITSKEEIEKMSLQMEKLEHNMAKITIEVPVEEMAKAVNAAYLKNKNQISIPGFRKGKVPLAMVEKMYGKGVFLEDAANAVIPGAYDKAVKECEEEIVSTPTIDVVQLEPEKAFIFTAEVALKPEVELGKYKGVKIDKIETEVTEDEVNEAIDRERKNNAREITVEDRPIQDGDKATIDFEGFVDGIAFEGGKGTNYDLVIGSHSFIDNFEEQLIGKNIGDALALVVESRHIERHARLDHLVVGVVEMEHGLDAVILYIILDATDDKGLSRMQQVGCLQLLVLLLGIKGYPRIHIALVLHRLQKVLAREPSLQGIVNDGLA